MDAPAGTGRRHYPPWVRTFDPDEELGAPSDDELPERAIDDDLADGARDLALEALAKVTVALPAAEHREGQEQMAAAVAESLFRDRHLVVEAGTGIGKSLAYLVPVALCGRRTVIATATKALQDQLRDKEVPAVQAAGVSLSAAVLKGRQNYLCLQRLSDVVDPGAPAFEFDDEAQGAASVSYTHLTLPTNREV